MYQYKSILDRGPKKCYECAHDSEQNVCYPQIYDLTLEKAGEDFGPFSDQVEGKLRQVVYCFHFLKLSLDLLMFAISWSVIHLPKIEMF